MLVKLIMLYKEWIIYFIYVFLFSYSNSKKLNFYFWTTLCGMCFLWRLTADETRYDYRVCHKVHVYCIKCFIYGDLRSLKFIIIVLFYETPFKSTWSSNLLTINNFIKFRIDAKTSIQSVNQFYKSELMFAEWFSELKLSYFLLWSVIHILTTEDTIDLESQKSFMNVANMQRLKSRSQYTYLAFILLSLSI